MTEKLKIGDVVARGFNNVEGKRYTVVGKITEFRDTNHKPDAFHSTWVLNHDGYVHIFQGNEHVLATAEQAKDFWKVEIAGEYFNLYSNQHQGLWITDSERTYLVDEYLTEGFILGGLLRKHYSHLIRLVDSTGDMELIDEEE